MWHFRAYSVKGFLLRSVETRPWESRMEAAKALRAVEGSDPAERGRWLPPGRQQRSWWEEIRFWKHFQSSE